MVKPGILGNFPAPGALQACDAPFSREHPWGPVGGRWNGAILVLSEVCNEFEPLVSHSITPICLVIR